MNRMAFHQAAGAVGVHLSATQLDLFEWYEAQLREWAQRVRLVSRGDTDHLKDRHFLDCLVAVPRLPEGALRLLDLGSGAGLPGVPIQIARPETRVTLLESARMKALFLKSLCENPGLSGLSAVHERAEALHRDARYDGQYAVVTARAVGALPLLWKLASPFLSPGGILLAFKGPGALQEFPKGVPESIDVEEHRLNLPILRRPRCLIVLRKHA